LKNLTMPSVISVSLKGDFRWPMPAGDVRASQEIKGQRPSTARDGSEAYADGYAPNRPQIQGVRMRPPAKNRRKAGIIRRRTQRRGGTKVHAGRRRESGLSSRHASGSFRRNIVSAGQLDYGARGLADARRGRSRASCPLGRSTMTGPGLGPPVQGFSPAAPTMSRLMQATPAPPGPGAAHRSSATAL